MLFLLLVSSKAATVVVVVEGEVRLGGFEGAAVDLPPVFCCRGDGGRKGVSAHFSIISWCWSMPDPSFWRWWNLPLILRRASVLEADDGDLEL